MARIRLDQLLTERGLARSRAEAQALIHAGDVELDGNRQLKPGQLVAADASVRVLEKPKWASRAGHKLEAALDAFEIDPTGLACLDAGASTGGFTDVLLARGARIVYAVDVGRAQLIQRLRDDPRVVSMERTNLRTLRELPEPIDLATLDLSFISLRLVLPVGARPPGRCGPHRRPRQAPVRGRQGRRPARRRRARSRRSGSACSSPSEPMRPLPASCRIGVIRSPIAGGDGNVEFLVELLCEGGNGWPTTSGALSRRPRRAGGRYARA